MARHKGRPSGVNKPETPTGVPSNYTPETRKKDHQVTRKYTDHDEKLAGHVRTRHPNRNVDKPDATNVGGYRN
jgi:hypothetical protein